MYYEVTRANFTYFFNQTHKRITNFDFIKMKTNLTYFNSRHHHKVQQNKIHKQIITTLNHASHLKILAN